mmetsp:Transcript_34626/g.87479  ORF Transcript_34626/g.87479 Transcript_34626/m.87479 type:complete len:498 (-) Transcript_34626:166-1659(-)
MVKEPLLRVKLPLHEHAHLSSLGPPLRAHLKVVHSVAVRPQDPERLGDAPPHRALLDAAARVVGARLGRLEVGGEREVNVTRHRVHRVEPPESKRRGAGVQGGPGVVVVEAPVPLAGEADPGGGPEQAWEDGHAEEGKGVATDEGGDVGDGEPEGEEEGARDAEVLALLGLLEGPLVDGSLCNPRLCSASSSNRRGTRLTVVHRVVGGCKLPLLGGLSGSGSRLEGHLVHLVGRHKRLRIAPSGHIPAGAPGVCALPLILTIPTVVRTPREGRRRSLRIRPRDEGHHQVALEVVHVPLALRRVLAVADPVVELEEGQELRPVVLVGHARDALIQHLRIPHSLLLLRLSLRSVSVQRIRRALPLESGGGRVARRRLREAHLAQLRPDGRREGAGGGRLWVELDSVLKVLVQDLLLAVLARHPHLPEVLAELGRHVLGNLPQLRVAQLRLHPFELLRRHVPPQIVHRELGLRHLPRPGLTRLRALLLARRVAQLEELLL